MSGTRSRNVERPFTFPAWVAPSLLTLGGVLAAWGSYLLVRDYVDAAAGASRYSGSLLLLVAAALPLYLGELFRRGVWTSTPRTATTPGVGVIRVRRLPLGLTVAWLVVALLSWVLLVAVPVGLLATVFAQAGEGFVWIVGGVALITSVTVGLMVASLVGRFSHARAQRTGLVASEAQRKRWRNIAGQYFPHLFLMATGFASLGLTPVLWHLAFVENRDIDTVALAVMLGLGVVAIAGGALIATRLWRSGEGPGYLVNDGEGEIALNFQ